MNIPNDETMIPQKKALGANGGETVTSSSLEKSNLHGNVSLLKTRVVERIDQLS